MRSVSQIIPLALLYSVFISTTAGYTINKCTTVDTTMTNYILKFNAQHTCDNFNVQEETSNASHKYAEVSQTGNVYEFKVIYLIKLNTTPNTGTSTPGDNFLGLKIEVNTSTDTRVITYASVATSIAQIATDLGVSTTNINNFSCTSGPSVYSVISSQLASVGGSSTLQAEIKDAITCIYGQNRCRAANYTTTNPLWNFYVTPSPYATNTASADQLTWCRTTGSTPSNAAQSVRSIRFYCPRPALNVTYGVNLGYLALEAYEEDGTTINTSKQYGVFFEKYANQPVPWLLTMGNDGSASALSVDIWRYVDATYPTDLSKVTTEIYARRPGTAYLRFRCGPVPPTGSTPVSTESFDFDKFAGFTDLKYDQPDNTTQVRYNDPSKTAAPATKITQFKVRNLISTA